MLYPLFRPALKLSTRLVIRADDAARRFRQSGSVEDFEQWGRLQRIARRAQRRTTRRFIAQAPRPTADQSSTSR